jgi:hypothetical protein
LDSIALCVNGPPGIGTPAAGAESALQRETDTVPAGRDSAANLDSIRAVLRVSFQASLDHPVFSTT